MEVPILDGVLFILSRLLEFINIGIIFLFAVRGVPTKYIYAVLLLTILSLLSFVVSLFFKGDTALKVSFLVALVSFVSVLSIAVYALRRTGVDIVLPEDARCPVCSAFVRPQSAFALQMGNTYLFFDQEEHLIKFLSAPQEYAKIRKLKIEDIKIGK
ncbi:MAG: hypothetical protein ACPLRS_00975, partial [Hydrogenobacter sp.]